MASCITRIHCGNCKKTWDVYWRDIKADNANSCPFCGCEIDRKIWDREVVSAASYALQANMDIEEDATGYNEPSFSINFLNRKDV